MAPPDSLFTFSQCIPISVCSSDLVLFLVRLQLGPHATHATSISRPLSQTLHHNPKLTPTNYHPRSSRRYDVQSSSRSIPSPGSTLRGSSNLMGPHTWRPLHTVSNLLIHLQPYSALAHTLYTHTCTRRRVCVAHCFRTPPPFSKTNRSRLSVICSI